MDFKQFQEAVPHHFGNGSDFRDLAGQGGRSIHAIVFAAKVEVEGKIFEIHLSNPYHPGHWNAWPENPMIGQGLIGEPSGEIALAGLAKVLKSHATAPRSKLFGATMPLFFKPVSC